MSRTVGTVVRGIRTPIIKEGDDLKQIVIDSVLNASKQENFEFNDRDIIAITEAVLGISTGNYATIDNIAKDVKSKFKGSHIGIVFPILSRNRFAVCLKAFARAMDKITMLLSYPSDEVGNDILDKERLEESGINPYSDVISEQEYTEKFGDFKHIFTGVNMVDFYREVAKSENCEIEFVFSNKPEEIINYTKEVLACDIHTRFQTKKKLEKAGCQTVLGMDDILTTSVDGSGYNSKYGLLGSNKSTDERLKLFPEKGNELVIGIQQDIKKITGKNVEVMIYGDGAFKDPVGKIWELADPVVSPFYTSGLEGTPNEIKLKYVSDNTLANLKGEELNSTYRYNAMRKSLKRF